MNGVRYYPPNPIEIGEPTNPETGALKCISYEHHEAHHGGHYELKSWVDLPINNVYDLQITTPNTTKWAHLVFLLDCEAETLWELYEAVTVVVAGLAMTPRNNNRNSLNTSGLVIAGIQNTSTANANSDTVIAGATLLEDGVVGARREGGISGRGRELILKQNVEYTLRFTANTAGYTNYDLEWYEHTNP